MALWLCLELPDLALEIFARSNANAPPLAVIEAGVVHDASHRARRQGVTTGMKVAAARALVPELNCLARDGAVEARALEQLAGWALQFTSEVSLQPPSALLLEVGGSLRYFDGLAVLSARIHDAIAALGYHAVLTVAPTPTGATLLAHGGQTTIVTTQAALEDALASLPVAVLALRPRQHEELAGLGCRCLGDCLALPRAGFARRFGHGLLRQLDRARGRQPDPRRRWQPAPRYRAEISLARESRDLDRLLFALERLITELCGYLDGLDAGVQRLQLQLRHHPHGATPVTVGLLEPSRDTSRLLTLARHRLERTAPAAPVHSIVLTAGDFEPLAPEHGELVPAPAGADAPWQALVERLTTRLGDDAVHGLATRAEHRPERAWHHTPPGTATTHHATSERPLWLLSPPRRLDMADSQPLWRGPLVIQHGPERIESGWWDGHDAARDYYIASNRHGERLWIFREHRNGRAWYLHGLFA